MKITKVECVPLSIPTPMRGEGRAGNILLVKLHTDEGLVGIGDAGGVNQEIVVEMVKSWKPVLIGANPLDRGLIMNRLSFAIKSVWGFSYPAAVCTIDFALWDLVGKALNQPVYQLLGGRANEKLRFDFFLHAATAMKDAEMALGGGVTSLGLKNSGFGGGERNVALDIKNVKELRKAVGDKAELAFDANATMDYYTALMFAREVEDCNLYKLEQPIATSNIDGLAALRSNTRIPICSHESSVDTTGLMEVITKKAADIVGTKLAAAGGITKGLEWAAIAKESNLGMYCGAMNGPWEAAAQAHWLCSEPEFGKQAQANFFPVLMYNTFDTTKSVENDLIVNPMKYKDGCFYPPEGPGIGLELNEKAVPKYLTKGKSIVTIE
ncbi:MAG TPA: mandelate racemase/muconate lactonizing enzyme family protein [Dehalococcoidia bacterium]|nr:mandelate racemase/muconate lactonizing enzyme family protein [Dehalococcoidia bacterium]